MAVPSDGGSESKLTGYSLEPPYPQNNLVKDPGTDEVLMSHLTKHGGVLARQSLGGGAAQTVVGDSQLISDFESRPTARSSASRASRRPATAFAGDLTNNSAVQEGPWDSTLLRYSNTGSGLLEGGCMDERPELCGLVEHELEDDGADIEDGDERMMLRWQDQFDVIGGAAVPARSGFDVQPQTAGDLIPGFSLDHELRLGRAAADLPFPELDRMQLQADGLTNSPACPSAGPTGKVMETALGSDIYKSVADHVREKYEDRGTLFGWDWRKRPQETFEELDQAIDTALARDGPWQNQKAGRVTLWGHSYGGLLIRSYIDDRARAARVARVLTAGTPYWGAPKSVFPLAFGIESPLFSPMDALIDNARMQHLSRNLAGLDQLYPSDHFPGWLTVTGSVRGRTAWGRTCGRSAATSTSSGRRAATTRPSTTGSTTSTADRRARARLHGPGDDPKRRVREQARRQRRRARALRQR